MSGHLYLRIGRYADAVEANKLAASADALYTVQGLAPYGPCHNIYFGVYAACMAGMKAEAVQGARGMRAIYAVDFTRGDAPGYSIHPTMHPTMHPACNWNALACTTCACCATHALKLPSSLPDPRLGSPEAPCTQA